MDLPTTVAAVVRERLAPARAAAYLALARPSVGFSVGADAREHGSVFGGGPRTAAFRWPTHDGVPMLLLAQIDCAGTAALLGPAWPFPADGYLLFFHDDGFVADGRDGCRVLHAPAGEPADRYDLDIDTHEHDEDDEDDDVDIVVIEALPLDPEPMVSLPGFEDHDDAAGFAAAGDALSAGVHEEVRKLLPAPRHRLLGWCDTVTARPAGLRPLLQVEAEEGTAWGEVVNVSFWISDDDLSAGRLDRVHRAYETA